MLIISFLIPYFIPAEMKDKKTDNQGSELPVKISKDKIHQIYFWQIMFESCDCINSKVSFLRKFSEDKLLPEL